jgi:hypothetical protein
LERGDNGDVRYPTLESAIQRGMEKERRVLVENLFKGTEFSDEKTAALTNNPEHYFSFANEGLL